MTVIFRWHEAIVVVLAKEGSNLLKGTILRFGHFKVGKGPEDGEKGGEGQKGVLLHGILSEREQCYFLSSWFSVVVNSPD